MRLTKAVVLDQLESELMAAGVAIHGLGTSGLLQDDNAEIYTYDAGGAVADLPAEAGPVIAAHVVPVPPTPPDFGTDAPADYSFQLANAVDNLRQYLQASSPTQAATVAALKLTIRVLLYVLRRQIG